MGETPLPIGAVVEGLVRRPAEVGRILLDLLSLIHWTATPTVHVAVDPYPVDGRTGRLTVPILALTDGAGPNEVGSCSADGAVVDSVVAAINGVATIAGIEPAPVATARFLRQATNTDLRFARFTSPTGRWTLCDGGGSLEIEAEAGAGGAQLLLEGPSPSDLRPAAWGRVATRRLVRRRWPEPGLFVPVAGTAMRRQTRELHCDVLNGGSLQMAVGHGRPSSGDRRGNHSHHDDVVTPNWTMEQIR